ncbi:sulfatase [Lentisphaera profundi]|uniref:Sulfatase n=1 Tax=Lentisphaera profundi TaxID=1658616 RepID=A0ABY7VTX6_9BACT|nr:sulfatase [Lentisphaera profundi]WDE97653.1 sulfatase [Lentisphaera profundi]
MKTAHYLLTFSFFICTTLLGADKPNIIIFLVDDMGMMDTSVPFITDKNGKPQLQELNQYFRTPAMEKLASQGIRFNQFCAQSVCSPSRASIISGQNATRHQTTTWINPSSNNRGDFGPKEWNWTGIKAGSPVLPKLFSDAGYTTIHIGKAHFGNKQADASDPTKIGFQYNVGGDCWGRPKSYYSKDHYGNHPKYKTGKKPVTHNVPHLEKYYDTGTFLTEALTLETLPLIKKSVEVNKPFFLHMSHYALHSPFNSDPRFADNYKNSGKGKSAQAFATLVEGMDKSLADVMATLNQLGIAEDTLIIFLGDNGSDAPLGGTHTTICAAPLKGKKGTHYEGGMRIPFIAAWAKVNPENKFQKALPIAQNAIQTQMATIMDIYPTVLEASGIASPANHTVDGRSLKTLLSGKEDNTHPKTFLMHFPHKHRSSYFTTYRTQDWKIIYHYNPKTSKPEIELYHLKEDPYEEKNLASTNPEKLNSLINAMNSQLKQEGALFPTNKKGDELTPLIPNL